MKSIPDYHRIYSDIIKKEFPYLQKENYSFFDKKQISVLDVIEINQKIFGSLRAESNISNQRHRSYQQSDIYEILDYQEKNNLNNIQLANHFKLSRNTIAKWKKYFSAQRATNIITL